MLYFLIGRVADSLALKGTPVVRSSSGSSHYLNFLYLTSTSLYWPGRRRLAICSTNAPFTQSLPTAIALASKLWAQ